MVVMSHWTRHVGMSMVLHGHPMGVEHGVPRGCRWLSMVWSGTLDLQLPDDRAGHGSTAAADDNPPLWNRERNTMLSNALKPHNSHGTTT